MHVTLECGHKRACLTRSFKGKGYSCSECNHELKKPISFDPPLKKKEKVK